MYLTEGVEQGCHNTGTTNGIKIASCFDLIFKLYNTYCLPQKMMSMGMSKFIKNSQ
jgi:hypothetical protein